MFESLWLLGAMPASWGKGGSAACDCTQRDKEVPHKSENGGSAEALLHGNSTTTVNEGEERDDLCQWRGT
jgi:hypothetical protein